jgi:hypothetical protein
MLSIENFGLFCRACPEHYRLQATARASTWPEEKKAKGMIADLITTMITVIPTATDIHMA